MTEASRIHEAIEESRTSILDALGILHSRIYETNDDDERRELLKSARALQDALVSLGDARHRANVQKEIAEPVVPWVPAIPYNPYNPPVNPIIWYGTGTDTTVGFIPDWSKGGRIQ